MQEINWNEWGKLAFKKADAEKKPILLDIHGVWCHWCHVMDSSTYSDPEVIEIVNKDFIPVKVDTDKRPDINKRYNQGGWPSTVFLSPTGQIITGTTYVPPESLKAIMFNVIDAFKKIKLEEHPLNKMLKPADIKITAEIIDKIMENMLDNFDFDYGGFGVPKFPMPDAIKLAFAEYKKTNKRDFLIIARRTLDKMTGIFDEVEGGFYRYSVTQQWNEPHYEKILETNAGVIDNYLEGFKVTKKEGYKKTAEMSLDYIKSTLSNEEGAFYGSQDADEEYYRLDPEQRKKHGNPPIDNNIYTDSGSMMISTYCCAYKTLEEGFYKDFAIKSAKFLLSKNFDAKLGMFHYFDGKRKFLPGILADNIYFIKALLDVFEITNEQYFLDTGIKLQKFVIDRFMDGQDNCFFDKTVNQDDFGFLKYLDKSLTENCMVAVNLIRLSNLCKNEEYLNIAGNILKAFYSEYEKYSLHGAVYGLAVGEFLKAKN